MSTPCFDKLLEEFPVPIQEWFRVMMGRFAFRIGECDNWKIAPWIYCKNAAFTQMVCQYICSMHNEEYVCKLQIRGEAAFCLSYISDSKIQPCMWVVDDTCTEEKSLHPGHYSYYKFLVKNEPVLANRVYRPAKQIHVDSHGLFVTKRLEPFYDDKQVEEKLFFRFERPFEDPLFRQMCSSDSEFSHQLQAERSNNIRRNILAYRNAVHLYGKDNICNVLTSIFCSPPNKPTTI